MASEPVVLAILGNVEMDLDGYYSVPVGLSDGSAQKFRISRAAGRRLAVDLLEALARERLRPER